MDADLTVYLMDVHTIAIERVPTKGIVRIKIKGQRGGWTDEMSLTLWGVRDGTPPALPEITDTTSDEPPVETMLAAVEAEDADL